ncbi:MAG: hypothetical protein EOO13_06135, partial [Chitinophagaceae bacterium]
MKLFIQTAIRWPIGCLIFFILSCRQEQKLTPLVLTHEDSVRNEQRLSRAFAAIQLTGKDIESGDLVTRTGNDFTSQSLRKLCQRDQTYSHCGIASIENDSLFIYHAMGGEWNPDEKLRRDPWKLFAEPYSNNGIGLFRFDLPNSTKRKLVRVAQDLYASGLTFDMKFDLKTDDKMYCAEFIYKTYLKATDNKLQFRHSR